MQDVPGSRPASWPMPAPHAADGRPWWRFGMVWFVIALPAVVVAGSFVLLGLAIVHGDTPITDAATTTATALPKTPAMLARNHAATPRP